MTEFDAQTLASWCNGTWAPHVPLNIQGVSIDTRTIQRNNLFIALQGPAFDGHAFLDDAFQKGASAAVVSVEHKQASSDANRPLLAVVNTHQALIDIAQGYRADMPAHMIAVTGSVGKTTVKELIADVLVAAGMPTARTHGNWNNDIGLPLSLLSLNPEDRHGVFEIGMNHPDELAPLCSLLQPDWGVITSVGPAHLEFFDSVKDIAAEKATLLKALPEEGIAFLDRDNEWFDYLYSYASSRVITLSLDHDPKADFVGCIDPDDTQCMVVSDRVSEEECAIRVSLPGRHMMLNALFAIAVGRMAGVSWEVLHTAISSFKAPPMRWVEACIDDITFVNDAYNANPMSMKAAIDAFCEQVDMTKCWLVLGDMLELGQNEAQLHKTIGHSVPVGIAGLITVGELGQYIAEGATEAGMSSERIVTCISADDAASYLSSRLSPGDRVLLKASRRIRLEDILKAFHSVS